MSRIIKGLAGVIGLLAVVVGLPLLLLAIGASPIPSGVPSGGDVLDALSSPDDGTLVIGVLTAAAWLAWVVITVVVVFEIVAAVRGGGARDVRGLGSVQQLVRPLVAAAALLIVAAPIVGSTTAASAAPTHATVASSTVGFDAPADESVEEAAPVEQATPAGLTYTVQQGDSLWQLAEAHYGDGAQYHQIVAANPDILDGSSFLEQGWQIIIPGVDSAAPAPTAEEQVTVEAGDSLSKIAQERLGDASAWPRLYEATKNLDQPVGERVSNPDLIFPGQVVVVPGTGVTEPAPPVDQATPPVVDEETPAPAPVETPAASDDAQAPPVSLPEDLPAEAGEEAPVDVVDEAPTDVIPEAPAEATEEAPADVVEDPAAIVTDAAAQLLEQLVAQEAATAPAAVPAGTPGAVTPVDLPGDQATGRFVQEATIDDTSATGAVDEGTEQVADDLLEEDSDGWPVRTVSGIGAIMAAGVIGLIAARRRVQQRRRLPGQQIPMPSDESAAVEAELRAVANQLSVEHVDLALRGLARSCAETGHPLPQVRAARLTHDQFELYLASPAQLPQPWTGTADHAVWTLPVGAVDQLSVQDAEEVPAPYPALVTLGHDSEGGHVFIDLEHIGALGISGGPERVREVMAAMAVELSTSSWADDLQITLVGWYSELEGCLQTGRIRYLPTAASILNDLEERAAADRQALEDAGTTDLQHARVTDAAPDAWTPEIVIITTELTDRQRNQVANLVDELPRVAIATITPDLESSAWSLVLSPDGPTAVLNPFGLRLEPQRITAAAYERILEAAMISNDPAEPAAAQANAPQEPTLADVDGVADLADPVVEEFLDQAQHGTTTAANVDEPAEEEVVDQVVLEHQVVDVDEQEPIETPADVEPAQDAEATTAAEEPVDQPAATVAAGPRILLLGEPVVTGADGRVEPSKQARLTEYAAYLALHPGATAKSIDEAIWPSRKTESNLNTRNTATSKLRSWLGKTEAGEDHVPRHQTGGYRLHEVSSDVQDWAALIGPDVFTAATENLEAALKLVRGRPFTGRHPRYYAWAEPMRQRLITEIADTAFEVARRRLMDGRWRLAEEAAATGLSVEPVDERLWRMRILAAHESRDAQAEKAAVDRLLTITKEIESELEDETLTLLEELKKPGGGVDAWVKGAI